MNKFLIAALPLLLACQPVDPASISSTGMYVAKPPTIWSDNETMLAQSPANLIALCNAYRRGGWLSGGRLQAYTQEDLNVLTPILRQQGLSGRDIELLNSRSQAFGTGQTFLGLACSAGYFPQVNKSFHQGVGHRWQAVMGSQYVYLEGDGTNRGMKVTGWN